MKYLSVELEAYLEALASDAPTPGGGSAAAIAGAFAAALVAMVARITRKNASLAEKSDEAAVLIEQADALRAQLILARTADEEAYARVIVAMALPKTTDAERTTRTAALQRALAGAAEAPLHAAELAVRTLRLAEAAGALGNAHLTSDVIAAEAFARVAVRVDAANVRANHAYLRDAELVATQEAAIARLEREAGVAG